MTWEEFMRPETVDAMRGMMAADIRIERAAKQVARVMADRIDDAIIAELPDMRGEEN